MYVYDCVWFTRCNMYAGKREWSKKEYELQMGL